MTKDQVEERIRAAISRAWSDALNEIFAEVGMTPTNEIRRQVCSDISFLARHFVGETVRAVSVPLNLDSEDLRHPKPPEEDDEGAMARAKFTVDAAITLARMESREA